MVVRRGVRGVAPPVGATWWTPECAARPGALSTQRLPISSPEETRIIARAVSCETGSLERGHYTPTPWHAKVILLGSLGVQRSSAWRSSASPAAPATTRTRDPHRRWDEPLLPWPWRLRWTSKTRKKRHPLLQTRERSSLRSKKRAPAGHGGSFFSMA